MKTLFFSLFSLLAFFSLFAFEFNVGPFEFRMDPPKAKDKIVEEGINTPYMVSPICHAIRKKMLIEVFVEVQADDNGYKRNIFKRYVMEPYAYGYNGELELLLVGYVVKENIMQGSLMSHNLDQEIVATERQRNINTNIEPLFVPEAENGNWKIFDINDIADVKVLPHTHFEEREAYDDNLLQEMGIFNPVCLID